MNNKYEPCSICENYIEGVICDNDECPVAKMKAEIERLKAENDEFREIIFTDRSEAIKMRKSEAIKEFAEELKRRLIAVGIFPVLVKNEINNLVKEMLEENKNNT